MEDSIVFLDKIYHVDNRFINRDTLEDQRLFSLSDYGFYMLIFKLSVHFSRIQEKVNRGSISYINFMGQQEYDNFKRLIKEWLDNHPDEYADFVEEMNDKKFKGFVKVFKIATNLAPKYKEATRKRIGDDKTSDFEELENMLLHSDLARKIVTSSIIQKEGALYLPCSHGCITDGAMNAWWNRERN